MSEILPCVTSVEDGTPIEALSTANELAKALAATLAPREIGKATVLVAPESYKVHDLTEKKEKAEPYAKRKSGVAVLKDLSSFLQYCADQELAGEGYIYADTDARSFTAVFNDYKAREVAGWRDHRATYKASLTPELAKWLDNDGKAMDQTTFAEFIEDNIADVTEPEGAKLLEVATTLQAKTDINFGSARRLDNGQVQLAYTEVIEAKAGADGALTIPREFALGLRIFKNGHGYRLRARLKYRLHAGGVKFWYELDRPDRAIEDAFTGFVNQVREQSKYTVLLGQA